MSYNSPKQAKQLPRNGLKVDRITRMIIEDWPGIWQAAVDRQTEQLEHRRVLILAARDQLRKEAS